MASGNNSVGSYFVVTATGNVVARDAQIIGFNVNSTSSGTITLYDSSGTATTTSIAGIQTPTKGYNSFPCQVTQGLYCVVGGTINVTFFIA